MVTHDDRETRERAIEHALERGDASAAATETFEAYGAEILGFIEDRVANASDAEDVFASFLETLWRSFERYRGECSARTWCYVLARRAIARHRRGEVLRRRHDPLSEHGVFDEHVARARSRTAPHLRTEVKSRARALRETLAEDDQQLLLLRLERGLSFREIAQVMSEDSAWSEPALTREAARLRKRFQVAKETLAELLIREGLVQSD